MANPTGKGGFQDRPQHINRKGGRPKDSQSLAALFRRIGHEIATDGSGEPLLGPDGKAMTWVEAVAREMMKDPKQREVFLQRGWGKVPDVTHLSSEDGEHIVIEVRKVEGNPDHD